MLLKEIAGILALFVAITALFYSMTLWRQPRSRGGILVWVIIMLFLTSLMFVTHAAVEVLGLGDDLYAVSGLVASIFMYFLVIVVHMVTKLLMRS